MNDTRQRITAPQRALRATGDFDPLDLIDRKLGKVEFAPLGDVVGLDTVDQHQDMIRFSAAHSHLR